MQSLEGDEMEQQLRAGYGGHDDRIMALGFIVSSFYKWDANYWRASKVMAYRGRTPALAGSSGLVESAAGRQLEIAQPYALWAYGEQSDTRGL